MDAKTAARPSFKRALRFSLTRGSSVSADPAVSLPSRTQKVEKRKLIGESCFLHARNGFSHFTTPCVISLYSSSMRKIIRSLLLLFISSTHAAEFRVSDSLERALESARAHRKSNPNDAITIRIPSG